MATLIPDWYQPSLDITASVTSPLVCFTAYYILRVRLRALSRIAELSQHEADGRKFQKREGVAVEIFPILGETTAPVEPSDRAFDDPTLGQSHESFGVIGSSDDFGLET